MILARVCYVCNQGRSPTSRIDTFGVESGHWNPLAWIDQEPNHKACSHCVEEATDPKPSGVLLTIAIYANCAEAEIHSASPKPICELPQADNCCRSFDNWQRDT